MPLSPELEVRSQSEPMRSVSCLGVVPSLDILPTRLASLALMLSEIAFLSASPESSAKSLSARYLSLSSLGVPIRPSVNAERRYLSMFRVFMGMRRNKIKRGINYD